MVLSVGCEAPPLSMVQMQESAGQMDILFSCILAELRWNEGPALSGGKAIPGLNSGHLEQYEMFVSRWQQRRESGTDLTERRRKKRNEAPSGVYHEPGSVAWPSVQL